MDGEGWKDLVINELWLRNLGQSAMGRPYPFTSHIPDQLKGVCANLNADGRDEMVVSPQSRVPEGTLGVLTVCFLRTGPRGTHHPKARELCGTQVNDTFSRRHSLPSD